jgi:hypothetical protein
MKRTILRRFSSGSGFALARLLLPGLWESVIVKVATKQSIRPLPGPDATLYSGALSRPFLGGGLAPRRLDAESLHHTALHAVRNSHQVAGPPLVVTVRRSRMTLASPSNKRRMVLGETLWSLASSSGV